MIVAIFLLCAVAGRIISVPVLGTTRALGWT